MQKCEWCGMIHSAMCPRVKAIEYEGGMIKRVEFHPPFVTLGDGKGYLFGNDMWSPCAGVRSEGNWALSGATTPFGANGH